LNAVRRLCDRTMLLHDGEHRFTGDTEEAISQFHEVVGEMREIDDDGGLGPSDGWELGVAEIYGNDQREQARQLIDNTAHPSVREELREEAVALGLRQSAARRPTTGRVEPSGGPAGDVGP